MSLRGKVVVITGGASGIGRATATVLAEQGAFLSLADRNETALAEVKKDLETRYMNGYSNGNGHSNGNGVSHRENVLTFTLDITDQEACHAWIRDTVAYFGQPIAGAANIAGVIGPNMAKETGSVRDLSEKEFNYVFGVNVNGTLNTLRAELPHMLVGEGGRGGGSIVNASSIAGLQGVIYNSPYVASKHAIAGITRTLALEEGKRAIRVNGVAPGIIDTPLLGQLQASQSASGDSDAVAKLFGGQAPGALARLGDSSEVGELIAFLLGPKSSFINGVIVPIEGGIIC